VVLQKDSYRPYLDGLRAIAIAVVVLFHAKIPGFTGGFVGVDVFFVISGFLITKHLLLEASKTGSISLLSFYTRRIRRLMPALMATIVFVAVVWALFFSNLVEETIHFARSLRYSVSGMANIYFMDRSGGYFDTASDEMPLLHFWSLAVEEQFYLVWPLAILLIVKSVSKKTVETIFTKSVLHRVLGFLGIVAVVSFGWNLYLISSESTEAAFYLMPGRAWEFAIGGLLACAEPFIVNLAAKLKANAVKTYATVLTALGVVLIGYPTFFYTNGTVFPGFNALPPVLGTGAIILGSLLADNQVSRLLSQKLLLKIGLLSYGIYLWHWPFLALLKIVNLGDDAAIQWRVGAILLSIVFAALSLRFVEKPLRSPKSPASSKKLTLAYGFACALTLAGVSFGIEKIESTMSPEHQALAKLVEERTTFGYDCVDAQEKIGTEGCVKYGSQAQGKKVKSEIFAWGDSHAFGLFPMVEDYIADKNAAAVLYSISSTPPFVSVPGFFMNSEEHTEEVNNVNNATLADMKRRISQNPSVHYSVILSPLWQYCLRKDNIWNTLGAYCFDKDKTDAGSLEIVKRSLKETLNQLSGIGVQRIMIVLPFPKFRYKMSRCLEMNALDKCHTSRSMMDELEADYVNIVREVTAGRTDIRLVSPMEFLCTDMTCNQVINDGDQQIPVVFDTNHPAAAAGRFLGRKIKKDLNWLTNI
jgi:peptidoglycan/LPS O-acetylase OafA/YrhL